MSTISNNLDFSLFKKNASTTTTYKVKVQVNNGSQTFEVTGRFFSIEGSLLCLHYSGKKVFIKIDNILTIEEQ